MGQSITIILGGSDVSTIEQDLEDLITVSIRRTWPRGIFPRMTDHFPTPLHVTSDTHYGCPDGCQSSRCGSEYIVYLYLLSAALIGFSTNRAKSTRTICSFCLRAVGPRHPGNDRSLLVGRNCIRCDTAERNLRTVWCVFLPLPALLQIGAGNVEVSGDAGNLDNDNTFTVTFTGVYGDVPLLTAVPDTKAEVELSTEGAAPYRKEVQAFSCTADSAGGLVMNWRGIGEVTVQATNSLVTLASVVSSGLTSVTVAGTESSAICSGELVYVTFEDVSPFKLLCHNQRHATHVDRGRCAAHVQFHSMVHEALTDNANLSPNV